MPWDFRCDQVLGESAVRSDVGHVAPLGLRNSEL